MKDNSDVLVERLYGLVSNRLDKYDSKFRNNIADFINNRHSLLFDIAPYDNIYFNKTDVDNLFKSLNLTEKEVSDITKDCFWEEWAGYRPKCAQEPYVQVLFMCIRYYIKHNMTKHAELTAIYTAFSGKFYASLFSQYFRTAPPSKYKAVMDYVVNNMLTDKFSLKKEGTVFGAIRSLCITWIGTYGEELCTEDESDDEIGTLMQTLRDRIKSFLQNIANLYYDAWKNRLNLNYETDNLDQDNFRLTDNDSAKAARITENTMNYITSNYVSLQICNKCKDENVKALEIKDIIESIIANNDNLPQIRRVINIIICDFMRSYPGGDVGSITFVSYTIKAKPNTKDPILIELKDIILKWLDENSENYRKRKSRKATQSSYYKSILYYFTLVINKVAK